MLYNLENLAGHDAPAISAAAVTASDSTDLRVNGQLPRAIWIGGAGNLAVKLGDDATAVTLTGVAAGTLLPIRPVNVMSTNTTATGIVALY